MDRQLDRHRQRIIDEVISDESRTRSRGVMDFVPDRRDWTFGLSLEPAQQPPVYNGFGQAAYDDNTQSQHSVGAGLGLSRLSFGPRNIYNQAETVPRTITNADNHFRFTQNLRQGIPLSQGPPRPSLSQSADTIDHILEAMAMQQPLPQSRPNFTATLQTESEHGPETANFFRGVYTSRLSQLQPQRQQVTPPFNLSGFVYSPTGQQSSESSSPIFGQASSPTTRVSLRRASHNAAASSTRSSGKPKVLANSLPETPRRQVIQQTNYTPQTLALRHAPPMAHGIQLVSPHELPDRFRHVFPYELFNAVQSKCFGPIYKSNDNIVVSAPTGSGKTVLLELAICKLVEGHQSGQFKIVYQAPTKSLCSERLRDWGMKFSHLNLSCAELTGDTNQAEMARVRNASIILTTPEKWDSITRKWTDHAKLVQMVKLFLIDEVHILKGTRGATLEAVVSRMKSIGADVRFIALSATVPNSYDIALWLGKDHTNQHLPAHRETFDEGFRPVKLMKWVHGFDGMMNDFAFEKILDGKLPSLIHQYGEEKKPIMVFCFTRKSCESTANILAEHWSRQRIVDRAWPAPVQRTIVDSKELQQLVNFGVAFHHAGLDLEDRHAIETAYLKGDISVICCTSTLAVGVNLPCHLVVLKGTVGFQDGKLCEYSDLEVMQMLGRAGRPQFDKKAVAVIMTRSDKVERYKKMISGQDILESTLHLNLIEHLNSEISLGTVNDLYQAKRWINGTFLSVRMRENPAHYRIDGIPEGGDTDQRLEQVCERDIKLLQEHALVGDGRRFGCTEYGLAMSRYMVQFESMKLLLSIPRRANIGQILHTLCQAFEFRDLRMKPAERPSLREFNKSPFIKYPIKENIATTAHKISLIIQVQLGGIELPTEKNFTAIRRQFLTDKTIIFERIQRLIRCVIDCKAFDLDAISTRHALDLARSLSAEFWENSNLQLRQIPQMGPVGHRKLINAGINSVEKLAGSETATIERAMSRNPPYGKKTKDSLAGFPLLRLTAEIAGRATTKQGQKPKVNVKAQLSYGNDKVPVWGGRKPSVTFMVETSDGTLVHFWRGNILKLENGHEIKFAVELLGPAEVIKCWIACEDIVGTVKTCILQHKIPASAFPPPPPKEAAKMESPNEHKITLGDFEDFGDDEFGDDEMLAVVKGVEARSYAGSEYFADIDHLEADTKATKSKKKKVKSVQESEYLQETDFLESVQMANGKWTCGHICRDGGILKNGKSCKHRCCNEGLDKPRKAVRKPSKVQKDSDSKPSGKKEKKEKGSQDLTQLKFKSVPFDESQISDTELIDLAQRLSPVPYEKGAPKEYRRLYNLHTKVQNDKAIQLPKMKPQFSYSSGAQPELPFLQKVEDMSEEMTKDANDPFESPNSDGLQEFGPSGSLHDEMDIFTDAFFDEIQQVDENGPSSSVQDDSLHSLEAGMMKFDEPPIHNPDSPASKVDNSLSSGAFYFDDFVNLVQMDQMQSDSSAEVQTREGAPPPLDAQSGHKRLLAESPEEPEAKHRRVTTEEPATQPAWVNDFDPSLIDSLKDYVDFVD